MTAIDDIKARIDVVDLVSETVKLRKAGKNYTGFCPFHPNSRTPAFVVFPDSGTWRCFGQCNEGGDVFKFVMKKEGWDFPETLRYLAQKAGVELEPLTPEREARDETNVRLRTLLEEAVTFYRYHLLQTPAGKEALAYIRKRGLTDATMEAFGLGYAPNGWEVSLNYFTGKGYTLEELAQTGLVSERQSGGWHDRFRNRVMFPIRDGMGHMAGFGARILDPDDIPKFLNSPQTALFDKGRLLYGLDQARKAIRAQDQVVIVEGYLDVIALHQGGFTNTVSPMGTALTEDQLRLLKKFTRRIVLALDADAAGEKATMRGLEVARQTMDRDDVIGYDPRGLLHHEARLQADLRVTTLPAGMDPDEVVLRDPEEWRKILEQAKPIVIHVMDTLAASRNMDDPKAKSEIAAQVLPLIEDVPDAVEREDYRQRLARLLKVDERAIGVVSSAGRVLRRSPRTRPAEAGNVQPLDSGRKQLGYALEEHTLRLLIRQPDVCYRLDRALQKAGLGRLSVQDFEHVEHQGLANLILAALEQEDLEPDKYLHGNIPVDLQERASQLQQPLEKGEPSGDQLLEDLVRTLEKLRLLRVNEGLQQMRHLQEDVQQEGADTISPYGELIVQYMQVRARLDKALGQPLILD